MIEKQTKNRLPFLITWVLSICLLLVLIFFVQIHIDKTYSYRKEERLLYLPTGQYLKPLCLDYDAFVSDMLWLKAIGYFGGHYLTDRSYKWLYHILDLITTLDPYFKYPYEFGGIILALEEGNIQQSIKLMEKGLEYHTDYWRLYLYIGFNYFFYLRDAKMGALYIEKASQLPGHPTYVPKLAASLLAQVGERERAFSFLENLYKGTEDEWLKTKIKEKIDALNAGKMPKTLKGLLQEE